MAAEARSLDGSAQPVPRMVTAGPGCNHAAAQHQRTGQNRLRHLANAQHAQLGMMIRAEQTCRSCSAVKAVTAGSCSPCTAGSGARAESWHVYGFGCGTHAKAGLEQARLLARMDGLQRMTSCCLLCTDACAAGAGLPCKQPSQI